ncbi:MAG: ATP-binding cassette domain-containing protein [Candidatus Helarchaeota archaeon]
MSDYNNIVSVRNLTKVFNKKVKQNILLDIIRPKKVRFKAVDNISFDIREGEIFGLLGPNGAGKTTTIKMLCGLLSPTSGDIIINKLNIRNNIKKINRIIGVSFSNYMLYRRLTVFDNLKFYCKIYNVKDYKKRILYLLDLIDLTDWKDQYVSNLSLGMLSKLTFIRSLLHDPKILFLDEPTLGLDLINSKHVRKLISEFKGKKTILLTSHYMTEVEELCDRIAFMNNGKLICVNNIDDFKKIITHKIIVEFNAMDSTNILDELNKLSYIKSIEDENGKFKVVIDSKTNYSKFIKFLGNFEIYNIKTSTPSLEDIFIKLSNSGQVNNYL